MSAYLQTLQRMGIDTYRPIMADEVDHDASYHVFQGPSSPQYQVVLTLSHTIPEKSCIKLLQNVLQSVNIDLDTCRVIISQYDAERTGGKPLHELIEDDASQRVIYFGCPPREGVSYFDDLGKLIEQPQLKQTLYENIRGHSF